MFIPLLKGPSATGDAIALLGALIMPHNLFLHSALVLSRKIPHSVRGINDACRFFLIESGIALFVAFLINVSIVAVSGAVCSAENASQETLQQCNNIDLNSASFLLKIIVISWILGIGLMGINIYYLSTSFIGWMIHSSLPKVATVFIGILVFPSMVIYVIAMVYLVFRKDTVVTFIEPIKLMPKTTESLGQTKFLIGRTWLKSLSRSRDYIVNYPVYWRKGGGGGGLSSICPLLCSCIGTDYLKGSKSSLNVFVSLVLVKHHWYDNLGRSKFRAC
ncbi:hypothetical protein C3L33_21608, partial [Rhododendron williamsianum]